MTADEAYFILWGRAPALGFYDHPPMVGWMLAPLVQLSDAAWVLRLPSILLPAALAFLVRHALSEELLRDLEIAMAVKMLHELGYGGDGEETLYVRKEPLSRDLLSFVEKHRRTLTAFVNARLTETHL